MASIKLITYLYPKQNDIDENLKKKVILTNYIALVLLVISGSYIFVFQKLGYPLLSYPLIPLDLTFIACIGLNQVGFFKTSRLTCLLAGNAAAFFYSMLLTPHAGAQYLFFAFAGASLVLFLNKEWKLQFLSLCIPITGYITLLITNFQLIPAILDKQYASPILFSAVISTFVIIIAELLFLRILTNEYEASILIQKNEAEASESREHALRIKSEEQAIELEKKLKLEQDMVRAGKIQDLVLPESMPEGIFLDAVYQPARVMSGDLWTWHYLGKDKTKIFVLLVDIQGKGAGAAMSMIAFASLLKGFLDCHAETIFSLEPIFEFIQKNIMSSKAFTRKSAACIGLLIDLEKACFQYVNAGMEETSVFVHDGAHQVLPCLDMPLGYEETPVTIKNFSFSQNDRLFLTTDGLKDMQNPEQERFGEEASMALIHNIIDKPLDTILPSIIHLAGNFQKNRESADDMTMLLIGL